MNSPALQEVQATVTYELNGRKHTVTSTPHPAQLHTRNVHLPFPRRCATDFRSGTGQGDGEPAHLLDPPLEGRKASVTHRLKLTTPVVKVLAAPQHRVP